MTDSRTRVIRWQWSRFAGLSPYDVYEALSLRQRVFVVEQNCAYQDADGRDSKAWHLLGWGGPESPDEESLIGYARVFEPGIRYEEMSIGRIVTAPEVRGTGVGRELVEEAMRRCGEMGPPGAIKIAAQRHLEKFYRAFGFQTVSEPYDEDGILHIDMVRTADGRDR